jgi:RecJ-like exonuclease
MDAQVQKTIKNAQTLVATSQQEIDAQPKVWINYAKEIIDQLVKHLQSVTFEVPCVNCDGNGYILGVTDGPDNKKDRPCKMCNGTGKKYNI